MLISENLNLIPHLTTCRDDLASETTLCQSLLRDISATGGGALSSHSLLDLVRALKEQRAQAEEALAAWSAAWEEREDELNFFWEEVLDDNLREELGAVFDQDEVQNHDPSVRKDGGTWEELARHFLEVDNQVKALRESIANLADESAKAAAEIDRRGMSGALSLTRTLREEVKEIEKNLTEARMGEGACRRKIEIIQQRIGRANNGYEVSPERKEGEDDSIIEDFQLRSIVQQHEAKVESGEERELSPLIVDQQQVDYEVDDVMPTSDTAEDNSQPANEVIESDQSKGEEATEVENRTEEIVADSPMEIVPNDETILSSKQNDIGEKAANGVASDQGRPPNESQSTAQNTGVIAQPSHAISKGMSTAIVVHSGQKYGSLSSHIWEILRMIVGLNRAPAMNRSYSHHSDENHPHIMVV
jgi:hypothetical protein